MTGGCRKWIFFFFLTCQGKAPCCNMENLLCKRAQQLTEHNHYADFCWGVFSQFSKEKRRKGGLKIKFKSSNLLLALGYIYKFRDLVIKMQYEAPSKYEHSFFERCCFSGDPEATAAVFFTHSWSKVRGREGCWVQQGAGRATPCCLPGKQREGFIFSIYTGISEHNANRNLGKHRKITFLQVLSKTVFGLNNVYSSQQKRL